MSYIDKEESLRLRNEGPLSKKEYPKPRKEMSGIEWLQEQYDSDWEKDRPDYLDWRMNDFTR